MMLVVHLFLFCLCNQLLGSQIPLPIAKLPDPIMVEPKSESLGNNAKEINNDDLKSEPSPVAMAQEAKKNDDQQHVADSKIDTVQPLPGTSTMPKMPLPKPEVQQSVENAPLTKQDIKNGLDTLNIDSSGNWLEKRIWYQKAEQLFEEIRARVQQVTDLRMEFIKTVNGAGHQIDDFYKKIEFEKGQIDQMLDAVTAAVAQEQQVRGGDLSASERGLKEQVFLEKKAFEQLSADIKLIDDLDELIDKTMMKAFKEIDACRGFETRSWTNFKEIGLELDDQKARVLYYEIDNFLKNIEQKLSYLKTNLLPYLQNQLIGKVTTTINQIEQTVQSFQAKGVGLQKVLAVDEHGDLLILKEREKQAEDVAIAKAARKKNEQRNTESGWLGTVLKPLQSAWEYIAAAGELVFAAILSIFHKVQAWVLSWIH